MSNNTITHVETVTAPFDDAHTDNERFVFCAFTENGRRFVARMVWRDSQLKTPQGPEYTDNGFPIAIYIEDPEAPGRPLTDFGAEDTDDIARAPYLGKAPSRSVHELENGLMRAIAVRLNPGRLKLIDDVLAHEGHKQRGQAGGQGSLAILRRIRRGLADAGLEFDAPTLASLGARSCIGYIEAGVV